VVTIYFWWSNIKGVPESSGKALRIMQITTVMVVILLIWCPLTLAIRGGAQLPPAPTPSNLHLTRESWGWLDGTFLTQLPFVIMIVALGHSLLAMSGFETLAQVYRELAYPKLNLAYREHHLHLCRRQHRLISILAWDPDATRAITTT
jgi:hypothetical protein